MIKSINTNVSGPGDLDSSSMSLSASNTPLQQQLHQQQQQQQQTQLSLKRTFCYAIVHAKSKQVTFYCFTTEPASYDSIKQVLDQAAETITQRHTLVNNIVLYKLGGLIGDCLMYDIKKVKQLTLSGCSDASSSIMHLASSSLSSFPTMDSPSSEHKIIKPHLPGGGQQAQTTPQQAQSQSQIVGNIKLPKTTTTILRQPSLGKNMSTINPSLITMLPFGNTSSPTSNIPFSLYL